MKIEVIVKNEDGETLNNSKVSQGKTGTDVSCSMYAKFFDEGSPAWHKNSEYNLMFLRQQENYASELLRHHGYLFLNKVYEMLGLPLTKAGQIVGWVYDTENPIGDNKVDFGLFDERNAEFVNGHKNTVLLDFNVDGIILDRLK